MLVTEIARQDSGRAACRGRRIAGARTIAGWAAACLLTLAAACAGPDEAPPGASFGEDVGFMRNHAAVVVLSRGDDRAQIAVVPGLQGRVMTSTTAGPGGPSFGWINRALIASGENDPHMNAFGGEDRLWLGPEGGQFSLFFAPGDPFDLAHWFTPPPLNEGAFEVVSNRPAEIHLRKDMRLTNSAGTVFDLRADRIVRLLETRDVERLGIPVPDGVSLVAFHSDNQITNTGSAPWTKEGGLLSIWILGMFEPSPRTTVVIPFRPGPERELGPVVNDAYFGRVPSERLAVGDGVLFFSGDGRFRSKIGIPPRRARPFAGSYDAERGVLTIVHLTIPEGAADYVNSLWEIQEHPFAGDVVNSYNDGPAAPGTEPLGPFYELESSSPAAALEPGKSLGHIHTTIHIRGDDRSLDLIARAVLGAGLREIRTALPEPPRKG